MQRALITGGCGFVGRHFATHLLDDGWHVTVVDDLSAGIIPSGWAFKSQFQPAIYASFSFHDTDVRAFFKTASPAQYDLIIHCAAVVGGRLVIEGDPLRVATDLAIDAEFFNWLARHTDPSKPKVVYFSSSAVYPVCLQGEQNHTALAEALVTFDALRIGMPDMTYGWAKLSGEYLAQFAARQYGIDVVIYRPFSGYGEDQSADYPFPSIVKRVVEKQDPVTVWGSGNQVRDFIHIDDVVDAVLSTMGNLKPGEALNLGSGVPVSFAELARTAFHIVNDYDCALHRDTTKPEGVFYRVADTYKFSRLYTLKISLEEGIRRVAAHLTTPRP
jgi:nucleoside-diphosphate-sugar epimerase